MKGEDYRRILDFFFSGVEVSEELKQRYLGWLAAYGDEPEVKALLRNIGTLSLRTLLIST